MKRKGINIMLLAAAAMTLGLLEMCIRDSAYPTGSDLMNIGRYS